MAEKEKPIDRLHGTLRSAPETVAKPSADVTTRDKALGERALAKLGGTLAPRETEGSTKWAEYLDTARKILTTDPTRVSMRITEPFPNTPPRVLVNMLDGSISDHTDIGHLLSPGFTINRQRPEGVEPFTIFRGPQKPPIGSSEEYTLGIRRDSDGAKMNIPVTDLVAAPDASERAWRLEVPDSLPDSFEPVGLEEQVA